MTEYTSRTKSQNFFLILMLGLLNALTPFSIDMYLPAFSNIAKDFGCSIRQVSFSVSAYFIGYALGQIFYGPLLDRFGRKRPIYAGLSIYILASIACLLSKSVPTLVVFRFIQALGGAAASVGAIAMVRDFFPVRHGAKVFSLLMLVLSASPLLAPTFGTLVVAWANWQTIFGILTAMALLLVAMIFFFLPEGHVPDRSISLRLGPIVENFQMILQNPQFSIFTFAGSFSFASLFVYIAGAPAIFLDGFRVSTAVFSGIFALLAGSMIGGGQFNILLTRKFSSEKIFRVAIGAQVVSSLIFFVGAVNAWYGLSAMVGTLALLLFFVGISYPNAATLALAPFEKNAGSASALLGFFQMGLGAVTSAAVGLLNFKGSVAMATVMVSSAIIALAFLLKRRTSLADQSYGNA